MLNNTRLNKIISESIHRVLLAEGQADKVLRNAIRQNADGYYQPYLDTPVAELPDNLRNNIQRADPNTFESCARQGQPLLQYFRITFLKYFDIGHDKGPAQYLRGIGRIALGELGFFNGRRDEGSLSKFKMCVMFLYQNPQLVDVQFDSNLNGMSYYDFIAVVNTARREFNKGQRERLSTMGTVGGDYDIVPINSEEEALKYGKYTSWCITHGGAYNRYATSGNRFYFCLRKGFENVPREQGEGCPLDDYGLSMISVLVDMDGEPVLITTRWNHDYDGENNENLRTVEQFQEITHINWYATFKPYTREELRAMGITPFDEVQELLDAGTDPNEIFGSIGNFTEGFAEVALNGKWNYLTQDGKFLSKQWFGSTRNFSEGFAAVRLNGRWNFLTQDGNILSEQWFDFAENFSGGVARVRLNGKWNFIDTEGNIYNKRPRRTVNEQQLRRIIKRILLENLH